MAGRLWFGAVALCDLVQLARARHASMWCDSYSTDVDFIIAVRLCNPKPGAILNYDIGLFYEAIHSGLKLRSVSAEMAIYK